MKISISLFILLFHCVTVFADDFFTPVKETKLRPPSVPIVTSDPYLSIWSPYNQLTEGNTEHWTGKEHPIIGVIRVDGVPYRFMGKDKIKLKTILPMTYIENWEAVYTTEQPAANWMNPDFDDSGWKTGEAAFATRRMPRLKTFWATEDIWIRRSFVAENEISKKDLFVKYVQDDKVELFLNGEKLGEADYYWGNDLVLQLSDNAKKKLTSGKNMLAAHGINRAGDGYVDFGLFYKDEQTFNFEKEAVQKSIDVLPTQTYYTFTCGAVELKLVFTAPLLLDDLDLVSTPINYVSYQVRSLDRKTHDVQVYFEITPELAVHELSQTIMAERIEKNNMLYVKTGTIEQPYTKRIGDGVRIDWGYAYLAAENGRNKSMNMGDYFQLKADFRKSGQFGATLKKEEIPMNMNQQMTALAYIDNLEKVGPEAKTGLLMVGYDDVYAIEYFYKRRLAYWKHDGKIDIFQAFERANRDYTAVMSRCRDFDRQLMADLEKAGGTEYAELCALVYRHSIAAHKIIQDDEGNVLFLSKENHSNGCINTVDLSYPSSPLYLIFNPDLVKGMMTSIFYFSESGRWTKPFPAHDLGTYPVANGQLYGGDMPVEESGNMIILATAVSLMEGHAEFAKKHWETLTVWANYLAEKGLDPENQLCTDDFAGRLAHNANLSIKAIMAIAGYAKMADMLGLTPIAQEYNTMARKMAVEWEKMANDGDHYRLAFDKPGTWSQKYNLVWDKVFNMNIFPSIIAEKEIPFYLTKQNKYGLPLDIRRNYTKTDWIMWVACLAPTQETFNQFVTLIYKYADETPSRIPLSDWHDTENARHMNFKARSVVGGYYMKLLEMKVKEKKIREKTAFQTSSPWRPTTDNRADVAIVYGAGNRRDMTFEERVQSWRDRGYVTQFMTGIAWGGYQDYFTGRWDGKEHFDEGQVSIKGDTIWHGRSVPYLVPTMNFLKYMKEVHIKRVIDAGIDAIHMEEPEFWMRAGYSEAFKREWEAYYGFPWRPQHESPENTYLSNKLKYHLYYRALDEVFTFAKAYGKSKGMNVRCYVPTHSLVNYSSWQIVSPHASLASLPSMDGYIAQVWTGTAREPVYYDGVRKERVFENAFLEYGSMESMTRPTGRKMFFLTDPIEDWARDWADFKQNYQATFTAQLLYPMVADYEVMPWPDRIYERLYKTCDTCSTTEKIPRFYSTQMHVMINALNDMPLSDNRVSGSQGIGVLMSNSLMFQRFPIHRAADDTTEIKPPVFNRGSMQYQEENYEDPQFSNFYGQTLPLLKRGIPVSTVHIENVSYPDTWKDLKVLVMSYSNMKPMKPEFHAYIARWVKDGGVLIYCGTDTDAYQTVMEWWNTNGMSYQAPSQHLFEQIGLPVNTPQSGEYLCGKGKVYVIRDEPKNFVMKTNNDKNYFATVRKAFETAPNKGALETKNSLYLERGPYIITSVLDESVSAEPLKLTGIFIDLFDPALPALKEKSVRPGEQAFLYDVLKVKNRKKPAMLCGASRVYNEVWQSGCYSFIAKSPIETNHVSRVFLPQKPKEVLVKNPAGALITAAEYSWDETSQTCLLKFENDPDGITVEIKW